MGIVVRDTETEVITFLQKVAGVVMAKIVQWLMISLYQGLLSFFTVVSSLSYCPLGAAIMIVSLVLFENEFLHIVSISFTAFILKLFRFLGLQGLV